MTDEAYKRLSLKEFDQAAEKFDDNDPSVYNLCRKDYPDVLAEVIREPFSDLLDAGCGTGAMLGMIRGDCPGKNYTGIDLSEKMIQTAEKKSWTGCDLLRATVKTFPLRRTALTWSPVP